MHFRKFYQYKNTPPLNLDHTNFASLHFSHRDKFEKYMEMATPLGNTLEYTAKTPAFDVDAYRASGAEYDLNQLFMSLVHVVHNPLTFRHMCYNTLRYGCRYEHRFEHTIMCHACPRLQFALNFRISGNFQQPLIQSTGTTYKPESNHLKRQEHDQRKLKRRKARPEVRGVYDSSKKTKVAAVQEGGAISVRTARGYIRPHYSRTARSGHGSY